MAKWLTITGDDVDERILGAAAWPDAPVEDLVTLAMLLDVAREQVIAYAPAPADPADLAAASDKVPARYVYAQLQQAKNLYNAGRVSTGGDLGDGAYTFTPRPLDKTIQHIIRPRDGKPDVY